MSSMDVLKTFLESIPQFIKNLKPGTDYIKAPGMPENFHKVLDKYTIKENDSGDGFIVSGRLVVPLLDLISFPGWHAYKATHSGILDKRLYEMYLADNGQQVLTSFDLEKFCNAFPEFYNEFLEDVEVPVIVTGNNISLKLDDSSETEDEFMDVKDEETDEDEETGEEISEVENLTIEG